MKKELNYSNEFPTDFNILIRKFEDCPQKKSDSENGYYIVSDVWGTCFHRVATKKERFEVKYIADKQTARTYTKIPKTAINNTYHCLVNFKNEAFEIDIEEGERFRVVGIHEPVKHVSKGYLTQTFIIYSISDFSIKKIETDLPAGLWIKNKNDEYVRPERLLSAFPIHYIEAF